MGGFSPESSYSTPLRVGIPGAVLITSIIAYLRYFFAIFLLLPCVRVSFVQSSPCALDVFVKSRDI